MNIETLVLTPIKAYALVSSDNEYSHSVKGYYSDYNAAAIRTPGAGWYGSDGTVECRDMFTDGLQLYEVKPLGKFIDTDEKERQKMLDSIKAKLTPEEWEFYNSSRPK